MSDENRGIETLRRSIESVAGELERHPRTRPRTLVPLLVVGLAATGTAVVAAALWLVPQKPPAEVEILELKIDGRPVSGIVVDDPATGGFVVLPQIGGSPRAAAGDPGGNPW